MGEFSSTKVACHWEPLLLLLGGFGVSTGTMGLQLVLLQVLPGILGLTAVLTLHLFALGHPAALHVHLQAAVEMEALVTGLTDEALLGRVWGGRRVFLLLFWQGTSLSLAILFCRLAVIFRSLFIFFVFGFKVKFITHLPHFALSIFLSKETCIEENLMALQILFLLCFITSLMHP